VLMNESITRAAGAVHGQELSAADLDRLIRAAGRAPRRRSTLYGELGPEPASGGAVHEAAARRRRQAASRTASNAT
jgi:hypothetical protein